MTCDVVAVCFLKNLKPKDMKVGVIMGSVSDYEVMADAVATLEQFGVDFEKRVVAPIVRPICCASMPRRPRRAVSA